MHQQSKNHKHHVTRVTNVIQGMKNPGFVFHKNQGVLGIFVVGDKKKNQNE